VVLRHKLNDKIITEKRVMVSTGKMETETGFHFGKWKRKPVSVSEPDPFPHPQESSTGKMENGKWKRKPVSVSEPDIPESQSMRACLWSIVVNSENSDPAKNKRADLPAAGKFTRGQKKKIPIVMV
jgi:hypothetical protein